MNKKQLIVLKKILFLLVFLTSPVYAGQVTFEEAKKYLANTVLLHEQENKSIKMPAYDYPAVNIIPLWQKLGIEVKPLGEGDSYIFGCKFGQKECYLPYPKADVIEHGDIKIIRISRSVSSDYQYLFFKKDGEDYLYFDHIEYEMQKYEEPKLYFLEKDLFSIKVLGASGTSAILYVTVLFEISGNNLKQLTSFLSQQERWGWGECFNQTINAKESYVNGEIILDYEIDVIMNDNNYESKIKGKLSEKPVIKAKRRIALRRTAEGFVLDKNKSNASFEDIEKLNWGGSIDYYETFKSEFDALDKGNPKTREWLQFFMQELKESKKNE